MQSSESSIIRNHADFRAPSVSAGPCCRVGTGPQISDAKPTIVFVCEHGSASIIAAAEFERMAKEKGLDPNILARGTNPDSEIPKLVRDRLKADGHDVGAAKPMKVSEKDLKGATKMSFGPDLSPWPTDGATVADWSATPSVSEDYQAAREYIRKELEILIKGLKK
jgi:hypothetical protein